MPIDSRWRSSLVLSASLLVATLAASPASAQGAVERSAARAHFERGVSLVNAGELEGAAEAFALAHRTSPHYSVLYNLGQAYATLGRSVDAVLTLEAFLRDGGEQIPATRRAQVRELIAVHRARIGELRLAVEPEGATVYVDGRSVGVAPAQPLLLTRGRHAVLVERRGFAPKAASFEIEPGRAQSLRLVLEREGLSAPRPAVVSVDCETPAVSLFIDGRNQGQTPFAEPLLVDSGARSLRFVRPGYRSDERSVDFAPGRAARVACDVVPDPAHAQAEGALLEIRSRPRAPAYVDGKPYRGQLLPRGLHVVRVERSGYRPWSETIALDARQRRSLLVELEPTAERRTELESARRDRDVLALGVGVTSLVALGGAAVLYAWNNGRYEDWSTRRGAPGDAERAASIERVDNLSLGLGFVGIAGLTAAGILWLTGGE